MLPSTFGEGKKVGNSDLYIYFSSNIYSSTATTLTPSAHHYSPPCELSAVFFSRLQFLTGRLPLSLSRHRQGVGQARAHGERTEEMPGNSEVQIECGGSNCNSILG